MASQPTQRRLIFWKRKKDEGRRQEDEPWNDKQRWKVLRDDMHKKAETENSPEKRDYINIWYSQMVKAGKLSDKFKKWYYISVTLTAVAAAAVPTLIAFTGSSGAFTAKVLRIVAAVLGVLVAGATTLLGVVEVGNRWRLYRAYVQTLEEAARAYLAGTKADDKDGRKYNKFVTDVDQAFKVFGRGYLNQVAVLQQASGASSS